ncbi:MBL fold metallo-hydrolase [Breoghania sp. L-A4]|uniref:MBL fold metallo-hydrolase n=1 Tax=Breoghania sp. L-A4 TaxID=2304600 RepID=UPI000E359A3D|nr:MBL fold metallo-hydrolase [Breoghania sp. L-A4]AXS41424.1 MBL fold metallo-hydrolase [Breoghania sp. L-A4]
MTQLKAMIIPVTAFAQNCTMLWNPETNAGVIIDPGGDVEQIRAAIEAEGVTIERILLTHGHLDHVGGAADLAQALGVPVEGPHEADRPLIAQVAEQGLKYGIPGLKPVTPDRWLEEGDTVEIAGKTFEVLHCPGHAPGHVVFVDREGRFAIVGDVLFKGSVGRTDLPGGDHPTLMRSIHEKLLPLGDDVTFLCGHGPHSTIGEERRSNPFLQD